MLIWPSLNRQSRNSCQPAGGIFVRPRSAARAIVTPAKAGGVQGWCRHEQKKEIMASNWHGNKGIIKSHLMAREHDADAIIGDIRILAGRLAHALWEIKCLTCDAASKTKRRRQPSGRRGVRCGRHGGIIAHSLSENNNRIAKGCNRAALHGMSRRLRKASKSSAAARGIFILSRREHW